MRKCKNTKNNFLFIILIAIVNLLIVGGSVYMPVVRAAENSMETEDNSADNDVLEETRYAKELVVVRAEPSSSAKKVGELLKDEKILVTSKESDGWVRVSYKNQVAYVNSDYLTKTKPNFTVTNLNEKTMYVKKDVNFRTEPNSSSKLIRMLFVNEKVKVLAKVDDATWYRVSHDGKIGYVHSDYLVTNKPSFTVTPNKKTLYAIKTTKLRKGPGTSYDSIDSITSKEKITTVAKVSGKDWYRVKYGDKTGYIYSKNFSTKKPSFTITKTNKTKYATCSVNWRKGPSTNYSKYGTLSKNTKVKVTGKVDGKNWYRISHKNKTGYVSGKYLSDKKINYTVIGTYKDKTAKITVYKEWYKKAYVYAAHIEFTKYNRLKSIKAKNGGYETAYNADKRLGAILTINGDYNADSKGGVVRNKKVYKDKGYCDAGGVYNQNTGIFECGYDLDGSLTQLVKKGRITDTMSFGYQANYIKDGKLCRNIWGDSRAQRTFMGTNGKAGDIWLCVSDGRYNDGKSAGLKYIECGEYLLTKGCTFAVPLDGGGSSTMVFKNKVLNANRKNQRAVVDFVYFK